MDLWPLQGAGDGGESPKAAGPAAQHRECGVRFEGPLQPALTQLIACDKTDLPGLMGDSFYIRKKKCFVTISCKC